MRGQLFAHALLVGMTSEEYWFGDPALLYAYEDAFNLKQKYDLQLMWTLGGFFKSALGSTQLWTVQPMKPTDWNKMPKYIENPVEKMNFEPKEPPTPEKQKLLEKMRAGLAALGYLSKK